MLKAERAESCKLTPSHLHTVATSLSLGISISLPSLSHLSSQITYPESFAASTRSAEVEKRIMGAVDKVGLLHLVDRWASKVNIHFRKNHISTY